MIACEPWGLELDRTGIVKTLDEACKHKRSALSVISFIQGPFTQDLLSFTAKVISQHSVEVRFASKDNGVRRE